MTCSQYHWCERLRHGRMMEQWKLLEELTYDIALLSFSFFTSSFIRQSRLVFVPAYESIRISGHVCMGIEMSRLSVEGAGECQYKGRHFDRVRCPERHDNFDPCQSD